MTFPNLPVATVRVCRITQRDTDQRGLRGTHSKSSAPGGRIVTAGDGNMVTVRPYGTSKAGSEWSQMNTSDAGSQQKVQEERPS